MEDIIKEVNIKTADIKLDQFLKWAEIVNSGGEAKELIQSGQVEVNGIIEDKRGHRLKDGDLVSLAGLGQYRVIYKP